MMKVLFILILLLFAVIFFLAEMCLKLITHPKRYSEEEMRRSEIDKGFSEGIDAYENDWKREAFVLSSNDATISGEFISNEKGDGKKVAIIAHGHTANRYASLKYANMFYKLGYDIVIYDERYFGRSTGPYSTLGQEEVKDLCAVIKLVKERYGEDVKIALHGESMGAATVLLALKYEKPAFVVADCPFSDSKRLFDEYVVNNLHIPPVFVIPLVILLGKIQYRYYLKDVSPMKAVKNSDVPICFMHGDSDKLIDCDHSKTMYKLCKDPRSQIHIFKGADHAESVVKHPVEYERILSEFIGSIK